MSELLKNETAQSAALAEIEGHGVQIHQWSAPIMSALEDAWMEVVEEKSAKYAEFERAWQSLSEFRGNYARWAELGYLE